MLAKGTRLFRLAVSLVLTMALVLSMVPMMDAKKYTASANANDNERICEHLQQHLIVIPGYDGEVDAVEIEPEAGGKYVKGTYVFDPIKARVIERMKLFFESDKPIEVEDEYGDKWKIDTIECSYNREKNGIEGWIDGYSDTPCFFLPMSKISITLNDKNHPWLFGKKYKGHIRLNINGKIFTAEFPVRICYPSGLYVYYGDMASDSDKLLSPGINTYYDKVKSIKNTNKNVVTLKKDGYGYVGIPVGVGECTISWTNYGEKVETTWRVTDEYVKRRIMKYSSINIYDVSKRATVHSMPGTTVEVKIGKKIYKGKIGNDSYYRTPNFKQPYDKGQKVKVTLKNGKYKRIINTVVKTKVKVTAVYNKGKKAAVEVENIPRGSSFKLKIGKKVYRTKKIHRLGLEGYDYDGEVGPLFKTGKFRKNQKLTIYVYNRKGKLLLKKNIRLKNRKWFA